MSFIARSAPAGAGGVAAAGGALPEGADVGATGAAGAVCASTVAATKEARQAAVSHEILKTRELEVMKNLVIGNT